MNWIDKLERRFPRFGIQNLTIYIIGCYVAGYLLRMLAPGVMSYLSLDMRLVFQGQIWRLVTWLLFPPSNSNGLLFAVAIIFFYYPIGVSLERTWGTFRYSLYIFLGCVFTVLGALILYLITGNIIVSGPYMLYLPGSIFTTYYISLSVFLAFAMSYPDMSLLLYFVIPIKMKWMAVFYGVIILAEIFSSIREGQWFMVVPIISSLLNFVLFFASTHNFSRFNPKQVHRRMEFRKAMDSQRQQSHSRAISKHKCSICGRTELDDPNLEFRFCSRCKGNYEYCQDHLFTHQHIV